MLAHLPDIEVRRDQQQGHRQAETADGFGEADQVRLDAEILETEEAAGASAAGLDIVHDQQRAAAGGDAPQTAQPGGRSRPQSAFPLHCFNQNAGRCFDPAARVVQASLQKGEAVFIGQVTVIGEAQCV